MFVNKQIGKVESELQWLEANTYTFFTYSFLQTLTVSSVCHDFPSHHIFCVDKTNLGSTFNPLTEPNWVGI